MHRFDQNNLFFFNPAFYYKKFVEFRANQTMVNEIHIRLEDQNAINTEQQDKQCYNNQKYNLSLLNWGEIIILFPMQFCGLAVLILPSYFMNLHIEQVQRRLIIAELMTLYLVGILVPLYILLRKKDIRAYFWMLILDLINLGWNWFFSPKLVWFLLKKTHFFL